MYDIEFFSEIILLLKHTFLLFPILIEEFKMK